jgi:hypothetical protein
VFTSEKSQRQKSSVVLGPINIVSFSPQRSQTLVSVISLSRQSSHTLWATHKFGLCSYTPQLLFRQFIHFIPFSSDFISLFTLHHVLLCTFEVEKYKWHFSFPTIWLRFVGLSGGWMMVYRFNIALVTFIEKILANFTVFLSTCMRFSVHFFVDVFEHAIQR